MNGFSAYLRSKRCPVSDDGLYALLNLMGLQETPEQALERAQARAAWFASRWEAAFGAPIHPQAGLTLALIEEE